MDAWRAGFQSANPDVNVNYDPVGSGGGRTQFLDGSVQFAGTDSALTSEELEQAKGVCTTGAIDIPVYISPIAVVFNLEGVTELNLSAGHHRGDLRRQDHQRGTRPRSRRRTPTPRSRRRRSRRSTAPTSRARRRTSPTTWRRPPAACGRTRPTATGPSRAASRRQGTSGVIQTVQGGDGTIAYADNSAVGTLGVASIKVGEEWVAPSEEAAAAAVDASPRDEERADGDIVIKIDRETTEAGAYPLILVSYSIACLEYATAEQADLVKGFLSYVVSAEGQSASEDGRRLRAAVRRAPHRRPGRDRLDHCSRLTSDPVGADQPPAPPAGGGPAPGETGPPPAAHHPPRAAGEK